MEVLIRLACMAPSVHNTQPWVWAVDGDKVHLFADRRRWLANADPNERDLIISCGAALHHLQVAAAGLGWRAQIRRRPNRVNPAYLATITFEPSAAEATDAALLQALRLRHTDRRPNAAKPVLHEDLDRLLGAAARFGVASFAVVSSSARGALLRLLDAADAAQRNNPKYLEEMNSWVDRGKGDGIPSANLLRHRAGDRDPATRFPSGHLADLVPGSEPPALLALCTSSDDVPSRLHAGEALSAVLLRAHLAGLSAVPLSQATEHEAARMILQDELVGSAAEPQIVVKVGWPGDPDRPAPPTPRRPLGEVLFTLDNLPSLSSRSPE
jgi:nitroreductase